MARLLLYKTTTKCSSVQLQSTETGIFLLFPITVTPPYHMSTTLTDYGPVVTSLHSRMTHFTAVIATQTDHQKYIQNVRSLEFVLASMALVSAEEILQTATVESVQASATEVIVSASSSLSALSVADNLYGTKPSLAGNLTMTLLMAVFFFSQASIGWIFSTWWFGLSYVAGTVLEMAGYIGRTVSALDPGDSNAFLCQIICLTIAPCFIMAGIYYLLAQLIVIYGSSFALLQPMRYSYIFITCDLISLLIQAAGGGIASNAVTHFESSRRGTRVMVAGLAFQVVSMSAFLVLFSHFCWRVRYLRKDQSELESLFNPEYASLRQKKRLKWLTASIFFGTVFIYIRSVYRVVELSGGWRGYLITHETYFMLLDALMMALTCLLFTVLHPAFVTGKGSISIPGTRWYRKRNADVEDSDFERGFESTLDGISSDSVTKSFSAT